MLERLRAARTNQDGFTLIELLIVVVILGVLAGVVVFAVQAFNDEGKNAACKTDLKTVQTAVEAYYAHEHAYPGTLQLLKDGNYIKDLPDPDAPYTITYNAGTGAVTAACA
ncbi:competence type IV pilus major pilin ComGC [Amycolatopsis nalaikhensis]|uniref:Prepilin-type N-terminal cleavage/methylation domain-containing protein n=1 Tax=Amycolatopsis nalaikhensis TaxID=715472 RepID=A0ABY8XF18_9PSEU|nr:prepilin-type N-terminal cleavage/methylation domain-containing protein [Amycolatopsis sp. 2-2]WIV54217.1 prepilin-type N-terminal cleavage/methylation domain-containing protein [Amycolatopsis sp. 2-2]